MKKTKNHRQFWQGVKVYRRWVRRDNRLRNLREIDAKIAVLQKLRDDEENLGKSGLLLRF